MAKTTYTAKFPDGPTITRKSGRVYTHAWILQYRNGVWSQRAALGFASSESNARKAAAAMLRYYPGSTIHVVPAVQE